MSNKQSSFQLLRAGAEHVDLLAPLFDAYRQFYQLPSDLPRARAYLAERLREEEAVVFLAAEESTALGFTLLYPSFSSLSMKPLWILNDLYVVPKVRRRGVARALLEAARQFAIATGAVGLTLETATDNHSAQRLYEQLGWQRETEFFHYSLMV